MISKKEIKTKIKEALAIKCTSKEFALSCAFGAGAGASPYMGMRYMLSAGMCKLFHTPIAPSFIACNIRNPITTAFIYALSLKIGLIVTGGTINTKIDWNHISINTLLELGIDVIIPLFIGGNIIIIPTAFVVYIVSNYMYRKHHKTKSTI